MILYIYINRHTGTPNKTKTTDMMSLDYSSICYIGSRIDEGNLPVIDYVKYLKITTDSLRLSSLITGGCSEGLGVL